MAQLTFGAILREAREHQGLDVASVARQLRIRPDILRSIEAEDFSRMPPRGYARNMINAYARLVGLNPSEITRMYLDAAYAFQVGKARSGAVPDSEGGPRRPRAGSGQRRAAPPAAEERPPRQNALGRTLYDDRRTFSRGEYDAPPMARTRQSDRLHPSRHTALPNSQYTNFYAGPQNAGAVQSKLPFIIAGAVILVLLVVIAFLVFGPKGGQQTEDLSTVPITGLTDTTQTGEDGEDAAEQPAVATPPTSVTVEYKVAAGQDVYAEVSTDGGAAEPVYLEAGASETVDVTGTWSLATWTTDLISVTVDGEPVEFTQEGGGIPTASVDFNAYLEKWKEEHPGSSAGSTADADGGTAHAADGGTDARAQDGATGGDQAA